MISTISGNVNNTVCNTVGNNSVDNTTQITQIESKRLEHLLMIEKNYMQIIAQGVQSTINVNKKIKK